MASQGVGSSEEGQNWEVLGPIFGVPLVKGPGFNPFGGILDPPFFSVFLEKTPSFLVLYGGVPPGGSVRGGAGGPPQWGGDSQPFSRG